MSIMVIKLSDLSSFRIPVHCHGGNVLHADEYWAAQQCSIDLLTLLRVGAYLKTNVRHLLNRRWSLGSRALILMEEDREFHAAGYNQLDNASKSRSSFALDWQFASLGHGASLAGMDGVTISSLTASNTLNLFCSSIFF